MTVTIVCDFINNIIDQKSKIRKKNWFNNINKDIYDSNNDDISSSYII